MHSNSKLLNAEKTIVFLEKQLFEHSKAIEKLEKKFKKFKFLPDKSIKHSRQQLFFENNIQQNIGKFPFLF